MLPTELLIITHGEAKCDRAAIVGGRNGDTGLTRQGLVQATERAKRLLDHFNDGDSDRVLVYTGRHERLLKTARIIAAVLDAPMTATAGLDGHRYGADVDGRPWTEVVAALGGSPSLRPKVRIGAHGETWNAYLRRLQRMLCDLTSRHPGQRIVVIGESATVEASMRRFAELDVEGRRAGTACEPAGLTFWREEPGATAGRWLLLHHNADQEPDGARSSACGPLGGRRL